MVRRFTLGGVSLGRARAEATRTSTSNPRQRHSTLYIHSTLYTPHSTLHTPHSTLHTPHSPLYTPHSTLYTPHFTLHTLHFTLYTLHSTLRTLHLHSTLYTPHSTGVLFHHDLLVPPGSGWGSGACLPSSLFFGSGACLLSSLFFLTPGQGFCSIMNYWFLLVPAGVPWILNCTWPWWKHALLLFGVYAGILWSLLQLLQLR